LFGHLHFTRKGDFFVLFLEIITGPVMRDRLIEVKVATTPEGTARAEDPTTGLRIKEAESVPAESVRHKNENQPNLIHNCNVMKRLNLSDNPY
jgi:hypothetical protein